MSDKYKVGLDLLALIETDVTFSWLLVKDGFTFNADHATLTDLELEIHEVDRVGYERLPLAGGTRTVNTSLDRIDYRCDWPLWQPMGSGQVLTGAVLYLAGVNDTASRPVAHYPFEPIDSGIISPFILRFIDNLIGSST